MAHTIRLTVSPELEKALQILRQSTSGTLNSTELIKMAIGEFAQIKKAHLPDRADNLTPDELDQLSALSFYKWAKEDYTLDVDNIAHPEKLKSYTVKSNVRTR